MYTDIMHHLTALGGTATMSQILDHVNEERRERYADMLDRFEPSTLTDIGGDVYDLREVGMVYIADANGVKDSAATYCERWETWGGFTITMTQEAKAFEAELEASRAEGWTI